MNELLEDLRKPFQNVFLDGRNEHGAHVLLLPGDSIGHHDDIQSDLCDQSLNLAEKILDDAEAKGFRPGNSVTTLWHFDKGDFGEGGYRPYYEYAGISVPLTYAFFGLPEDQQLSDSETAKGVGSNHEHTPHASQCDAQFATRINGSLPADVRCRGILLK